jgi:hypothetical protein
MFQSEKKLKKKRVDYENVGHYGSRKRGFERSREKRFA